MPYQQNHRQNHYWRRMLCQRLCRGLPSAKTPRGIFRRRRAKPLPRARTALGKEKKPSGAGAVGGFFAEGPPSAKKWFFLICLPRAGPRQIIFFIFFKKPLPRASSLTLGKEIFRIFPKKTFAEGSCNSPRQRFFLKKNCLLRAGPRQRNSFF